ncbi:hypothetical protein OUZ56_012443 [Daphnia magna]|uniref:Uncharacterized protein n=1 Tax=Daphnia magna TaxID=35525 RepID=A0ABQ9Z325_9CRUS|nr:hypothetical protein OUZ56_012443 [Daphnia magna]
MGGWWVYLATLKVPTTTASSASPTARIAISVSAEVGGICKDTKDYECQLDRLTVTGGREEITVQIDSFYLIQS